MTNGRLTMQRSQATEGHVRDLGHAGDGIVETDRGLVFVPGALPDERVLISHIRKEGRILRGELARVLTPSKDRVEPPCAYASECGGCPLMTLAPAAQLEHGRERVARAAGLERSAVHVEAPEPDLAYRRRARFAFERRRGAPPVIGYRAPRARRIVAVPTCAVVDDVVARGLIVARAALIDLDGAGDVTIAHGHDDLPVLWIESDAAQPAGIYEAAREAIATGSLAGVALAVYGAARATIGRAEEVTAGADGTPLVGPPFGFAQAHGPANARLVARVVELARADGARVVELYAGSGNLTVALAASAADVVSLEHNAEACALARQNLAARGLGGEVHAADAASALELGRRADVVVLDPPREGAREALDAIVALEPRRIVYVSCDPATLGRDVAVLSKRGFHVEQAVVIAMFPHTAHVEAVVSLVC